MPRYKLTIAYDGTDFCGWQKQEPFAPEGTEGGGAAWTRAERAAVGEVVRDGETRARLKLRTVQEVVERAVREIVREPVMLTGASRTDAGVHARGQVGAFTCGGDAAEGGLEGSVEGGGRSGGWPEARGVERLVRAVNGRLPEDVLVAAAEVVGGAFNPIGDCTSKGYSFTIHASRERTLWDRRYVHQVWEPLDAAPMRAAAARIVGEHDFAAFAAAGHGRRSTVRTVHACEVVEAGGGRIRIEVSGNGFLYNMVRIIAGTLVDAGRGRTTADDVARAIEGKDRRGAGPTLPASGLCLEWIRYDGGAGRASPGGGPGCAPGGGDGADADPE